MNSKLGLTVDDIDAFFETPAASEVIEAIEYTYYEITGLSSDATVDLFFGSYVRADCVYELDAERAQWKDEGYKNLRITSRQISQSPDPDVYSAAELATNDEA